MTNAYQVSIAARQLLEGFRRNLSQMTQEDA